jgi:transcriptional regulator PpsR
VVQEGKGRDRSAASLAEGPARLQDVWGADGAAALVALAGDLSLLLDIDGTILDVSASSALEGAAAWIGRPLTHLVTVEGRPKIAELLADAAARQPPRWRQVTHVLPDGEVPIRYAAVIIGSRLVLVGRDMRADAALQQRLLQAQQSLERDYLRLRQAEARYRLLFDLGEQALVIVDAASWRVVEANAAAHRLLEAAPGTMMRQTVGALADPLTREAFLACLGATETGVAPTAHSLRLRNGREVLVTPTPFRQERATLMLLRFDDAKPVAADGQATLRRVVEQMPDAFVLTGRSLAVVAANGAFLDITHEPSFAAVAGEPLGKWLGRPGVDLDLILAELRKTGVIRNVASIVRGRHGLQEEVEVSAVLVEAAGEEHLGFILRSVARRLRDLPPAERDLPRSVEQLTELVGRVSLKDIVRESSDLIERLCIEAALAHTSDNRASAAEILGLSRQGLYSKLNRYGMGKLVDDE